MTRGLRARCPFCRELYLKAAMQAHITERHFPTHCTVCDRTPNSHPTTETSPPYTMPCEGGCFEPGRARR